MSSSSSRVRRDVPLARRRHGRADPGDLAPGEERVPVEPLEHELPEVVEARLPQKRKRSRLRREAAGQRLGGVVEVDQQGLREARLDEAVRVTVVAPLELLSLEEADDVLRD